MVRLHHFPKVKSQKRYPKTVEIKAFLTIFAAWLKDPDPDPYLWLMDSDPDPGGPKHLDPVDPDPDPDSDPDPQHWYSVYM